jgi:AcrR family transcriptional regulator
MYRQQEKRMSPSQLGQVNTKLENIPRREREKLRQRREILDAALRLFSEKGYHNVSMHEIAKEAEFGIGTLYKFFRNKEELYKALIMEMAESSNHALVEALEQERNPLLAINKYIAVRRELFFDNLPLNRLYFAETRGASFNIKAGLDHDLLKLYDQLIDKLASVFERGVNQSVFRALDPQDMALALEGMINSFLFRIMEYPARFRETDNLSTAAEIFFKGVLDKQ